MCALCCDVPMEDQIYDKISKYEETSCCCFGGARVVSLRGHHYYCCIVGTVAIGNHEHSNPSVHVLHTFLGRVDAALTPRTAYPALFVHLSYLCSACVT